MGDKRDQVSLVNDSGVPESVTSASTVQTESPGSSPSESPTLNSLGQFTEIGKGVLFLSDSSQASSQTEKASAEAEDVRWNSAVSSSTAQNTLDVNLPAKSAMVHPNQESRSRLECEASKKQPWKSQVPTLDSYAPAPDPPVSMGVPPSPPRERDQTSFTVGPPNAVPLEEENVESSSDIVVQKPEMVLTGDAKEDKRKIQTLEAKLRDTEAKVEKLKKELADTIEEKKEGQRELAEAKEKIKQMEAKSAEASAAMQRKHEEEIKALKERLANTEKEKSDQQAEYCKRIGDLNAQLKQLEKEHCNEKLRLVEDKYQLELKVERMNTNEERLKRELSDAKLEAVELRCKLMCREQGEAHAKDIAVLRTQSANALAEKETQLQQQASESANALAEKETQLQRQASEIKELKRLLSSQTSSSSQGSGTE